MENETKWCPGYDRDRHEAPITEFYHNKGRSDGLSALCIECHGLEVFARRIRLRLEAIKKLGGCCLNPTCAVPGGMKDIRALQFDHINGNGRKRRADGENGHQVVKSILAGSTEFQLLCANCNWIKKAEQMEWVGERVYNRVVPIERKRGPGKGSSESGKAALDWKNWDEDQQQEVLLKRSEARRKLREQKVIEEQGLPAHPSWEKKGLEGCFDCGTRVRAYTAKNLCNTCYVRSYNASKKITE